MNELAIINPKGSIELANKICRYIAVRKREVLAAAEAVTITEANWNDAQTKDAVKELEEMVEDLRDRGKRLVADVCAAAEAQRVLTAIDSRLWNYSTKADPLCAYQVLKNKLDEIKAQIKAFKDAATPKAPPRTFIAWFTATDKQMETICKAAAKAGAAVGNVAVPQGDKNFDKIEKWFKANM